jgi:TetR/AcrR family transcriptional regulator, transcriptional repressor of bet genes
MPKIVDARLRRSEFVDATWRVIRKEGLPAATLRRVAAEARCTTGALTHYFSNREALLVQALRAAHFAAGARMVAAAGRVRGDLKRLETLVLEALPLDAVRMNEWKTHLTFWGEACDNEKLRSENARRFAEWGQLLEEYMAPIVPGEKARRREAMLLMGLIDGLALRLVLQARRGSRNQADATEVADAVRSHLRAMQARY